MNAHGFRAAASRVVVIALALAMGSSCSDEPPVAPAEPDTEEVAVPQQARPGPSQVVPPDLTPFQESIQSAVAARRVQGLPVPVITYDYSSDGSASARLAAGEQATVTATTTIVFDDPVQAGHDVWPRFVVEDNMPPEAEGFVQAGDYTDQIRDRLALEIPGVWDQYQFGYEPRTYVFTEEYILTGSEQESGVPPSAVTLDEILMGFTYTGPNLDYTIGFSIRIFGWEICGFRAGFALDWGLGVRLPMEMGVTAAAPLLEGMPYSPTSVLQGLDWTATDYSDVGVAPESGNEFVLRFEFFLGIRLTVFGVPIVNYAIDVDIDKSSSFKTPFGPGEYFALPSLDVEIFTIDIGVASGGVGFALTPKAGSDKFTASWAASGDGSGGGALLYSDPAVPVALNTVLPLDGPGMTDVRIDQLEYWFNQFLLELALYFRLNLIGLINERWDIPLADFDLSGVLGDLGVGVHPGTVGHVDVAVPVANVVPTGLIDRSAAWNIQGVPTLLMHTGDAFPFTGTAADPGRDDLTLSWDWDDGGPAPDVSTFYPLPGEVTETQPHACQSLCLYSVGFQVVDDDGALSEDRVAVVSCGPPGTAPASADAWIAELQTGVAAPGNANCLLAICGHMSGVFGEVRDASTPAAAEAVLAIDPELSSGFDRLDRELLLTWLNFSNGAFDYMDLVDTDEDGVPETPFAVVVDTAEMVRLNPGSTNKELFDQIMILRDINEPNAPVGGI
jgi:hypothetical protein